MMSGKDADYLAAFGYDAANLALGKFYTQKSGPAYFFDPSGYIGTTGVFRIQPTVANTQIFLYHLNLYREKTD